MEYVQTGSHFRGVVKTIDDRVYPGIAAWPDRPLAGVDVRATLDGRPTELTSSVAPLSQVGQYQLVLDTSGLPSGSIVAVAIEYEVVAVRYEWSAEVFVVDSVADIRAQTSAPNIRSAVGLESANLASLVNAVVGKNVVTPSGADTYDIAVRNADDTATLVTIRFNALTGAKTVV